MLADLDLSRFTASGNAAADQGERSEKPSQVMIDKVMSLPLDKLSNRIGAVSSDELDQISASLRAWMDL
jgi:mRNA-degrading endonuclease toxin of MazEF toxin-antitoxin module